MSVPRTSFAHRVFSAVTLCLQSAGLSACGGIAEDSRALDVGEEDVGEEDTPLDNVPPRKDDPPLTPPDVPPEPPEPEPEPHEFTPPPPAQICVGSETDWTQGLDLPSPPEFLGVVETTGQKAWFVQSSGRCLGSSDEEICAPPITTESLVSVPPLSGQRFLVAVNGDVVAIINNYESLTNLLGSIDTATEAELILRSLNYDELIPGGIPCGAVSQDAPHCLVLKEVRPLLPADNCSTAEGERTLLCVREDASVFETVEPLTVYGQCLGGRRPDGLIPSAVGSSVSSQEPAGYFAELYRLETAAVAAFAELAYELSRHGAPESLVHRARTAALDEVRHSLMAEKKAAAHGAVLPLPEVRVARKPERSLFELALQNATEGCVRESFGAAQALLSARGSQAESERQFWQVIAGDEMRHAELSREVAVWLSGQLTRAQKEEIQAARALAYRELEAEVRGSGGEGEGSAALQLLLLRSLKSELLGTELS